MRLSCAETLLHLLQKLQINLANKEERMLSKLKQLKATLEKWVLTLSSPQSSQMMLGKSL